MSTLARTCVLLPAMAALLALAAVPAQSGTIGENLVVTITVDEGEAAPIRTYRLITRDDGSRSRLNTGWRVPIPTTKFAARDEGDRPGTATSYTYQNVGLTAVLEARSVEEGIALRGSIEISAAKTPKEQAGGNAPTIGAFQQEFDVLLQPGQPLELADVSSPRGGKLSVSVRVERLN